MARRLSRDITQAVTELLLAQERYADRSCVRWLALHSREYVRQCLSWLGDKKRPPNAVENARFLSFTETGGLIYKFIVCSEVNSLCYCSLAASQWMTTSALQGCILLTTPGCTTRVAQKAGRYGFLQVTLCNFLRAEPLLFFPRTCCQRKWGAQQVKMLKRCHSVGKAALTTKCSVSFQLLHRSATSHPTLFLFAVGSGSGTRSLKAESKWL